MADDLTSAMDRARRHAPFLAQAMDRLPGITALLTAGDLKSAMEAAQIIGEDEDITVALRKQRLALALVLAIGDLAGHYDFRDVTRTLSDFADRALDMALNHAFAQRVPDAQPAGFAFIALGKHGGQELNYSSDIDPIFLYDAETIPRRRKEEPGDAAQRIARTVIETLSARDAHGYVFRVDMRLRPASEVSPLALPVEGAISHYESSALPWEQAAFIRARVAGGDTVLGDYFMQSIRPFIWRRSLDFGTIDEIGALTSKIRDHYAAGLRLGGGYDLKRGRGGIREVEFFAQVHQLIHGGRNHELRSHRTLDALSALSDAGIILPDTAETLDRNYRLLRTIEHRLQMVDDRQTHSLPEDENALENVAKLHGLDTGTGLIDLLAGPVEEVGNIYDGLIGSSEDTDAENGTPFSEDIDALAEQIKAIGFSEPEAVAARIEKWRGGTIRSIRSTEARRAFETVLPAFMEVLGKAPDPANAFNRFGDVLQHLPSSINFFRLLEARPGLMQLMADVLSLAPVLAGELARRSDLLDGMIDASALDPLGDVDDLAAIFARMEAGDDYQRLLDNVRLRVGEKRFALGVQLIEASTDPLTVASGYANVAEAALKSLTDATIAEFEQTHGQVPGCELVILALGRLGGQALTHASDLDLIFLFTGDHGGSSDGDRSLGATQYFNRLAQRVVAALSVPTASGALYEVDTRLRPSGMQGLLCVTMDSFWQYQREQAWVWEHMALCRARPVYGPLLAQESLERDIHDFLADTRGDDKVVVDAAKMRQDMAKHKPPSGPLDAKLLPGGLVDLEFVVHTLQLTTGKALHPQLGMAISELADEKLVPTTLVDAHAFMTRLLASVRLVAPDCQIPLPACREVISRACQLDDWDEVLVTFDAARANVREHWLDTFGTHRTDD